MSNARKNADVAHIVGRKNLIINGDFKVSQRGDFTTASAAVDGAYYLDRWTVVFDTVGVTKQDTGNAMKVVATSSGTGSLRIRHKFEDTTYLSSKTVTISCQMKSNSSNARINVYADGWQSATSTHTGGGAWESVSLTLTLPAGVSSELSAHFGIDGVSSANVSVTSGDYCEVKECQLELGSVATDFEYRSYGEELALCQRYYYKTWGFGIASSSIAKVPLINYHSYAKGGNQWEHKGAAAPVTLRANPTVRVSDQLGAIGKINHFTSTGGGSTAGHTPYSSYGHTGGMSVSDYQNGSIYGFSCQYELEAEL